MAAKTLSLADQKKALSAKKKKKVVKNVLNLPTSLKVESTPISEKECVNLTKILHRLLPIARIPAQLIEKNKQDNEETKIKLEEEEAVKTTKNKRSRLALGVNELNRSIKKNLISAALLASDIHPKFLIHHLNLLCQHNEIPFLHIPGLRKLTQNSLGFPCIALGFKKDSTEFNEVITEIQSLAKNKNVAPKESDQVESETSDSEEEEEISHPLNTNENKTFNEKKFSYLYRNSISERVFSPENYKKEINPSKNLEDEYIGIDNDVEIKIKTKVDDIPKGISTCLIKKKKAKKKQLPSKEESEICEFIDEHYEVPKKKAKVDWRVDKVGERKKFKYSPANVVKFHSNENRTKRKSK